MQNNLSKSEISLGLITKDQEKYLSAFLNNFLSCISNTNLNIPLIVINDGSTDGTYQLLESKKEILPLLVVKHIPPSGRANARNEALKICGTKWLAFTDSDCIFDETYITTLIKLPSLYISKIAVEGKVTTDSFHPSQKFTHYVDNLKGGTYVTANMVYNVPRVLKLGGFDVTFKNYREDVDLGLRINAIEQIPFCSDLCVHHPRIKKRFISEIARAVPYWKEVVNAEYNLFTKHKLAYSKVRHFKSFNETLNHWCLMYMPGQLKMYLKESLIYFKNNKLPATKWTQIGFGIITSFVNGMVMYGWEQLVIIYLGKFKRNFR